MCRERLCLRLTDSLNAAFGGDSERPSDLVGSWGREVREAIHYRCLSSKYPLNLLHQVAFEILQAIIGRCPCEGMAEAILQDPERFLNAVVVLAAHLQPAQTGADVLH